MATDAFAIFAEIDRPFTADEIARFADFDGMTAVNDATTGNGCVEARLLSDGIAQAGHTVGYAIRTAIGEEGHIFHMHTARQTREP